jgi:hypothetical protein
VSDSVQVLFVNTTQTDAKRPSGTWLVKYDAYEAGQPCYNTHHPHAQTRNAKQNFSGITSVFLSPARLYLLVHSSCRGVL